MKRPELYATAGGDYKMLQLIGILAMIAVAILAPVEVNRIRAGHVPAKFAGDSGQYAVVFGKQLTYIMWIGIVLGSLFVVVGLIESDPASRLSSFISVPFYYIAAAACWLSRSRLPQPS